ncbi:YqeG family HAD IIIA-type phosphatase [Halalkalibacillus sediminis]|uniref:YqeG family HAD IIIA-type phosphatase n=1 Tax=Halalkalibacillus sediminis TaxID=2018042 RepID=A0A2I0QXJ9_9BACI|nr:YqeG family HAD IIIA-type phosphatase [Halalkalibacillus sediminis]PKR79063.1 YqeG family HAD IIIA-type phosphatase [Halalkalibacillus sediminis]
MLNNFLPNDHVQTVFEITPEFLHEKGIKGVITDLDNTLVAWDQAEATPEIIEWFKHLKSSGIEVTIMSNNSEKRVSFFSEPLDIPFIYKARKPKRAAFKRAKKAMELPEEQIVVVGDQLLTDVFGGNRANLFTVLVVPIVETDGFFTRFNRLIEKRLLDYFKSKGKLNWEE